MTSKTSTQAAQVRITATAKAPWHLLVEGHVVGDAYPSRTAVRQAVADAKADPEYAARLIALAPIKGGKSAGEIVGDALVANAERQAAEAKTTGKDLLDAQDRVAADKTAGKAKAAKAKVNGRKAAADKSPYSTAPVAGYVKREGKSRRTGTMTRVIDLLHPKTEHKIDGDGRYRIECLTHGTHATTPDMTAAKPLQARTDEFCPKCVQAVKDREAGTAAQDAAKNGAKATA